ncbi:hypothetical protein [Brenneria sp. L3-3Z]
MTALLNPNRDRWQFDYDNGDRLLAQTDYAGRRTQKVLYPHHGTPETVTFHWNGLRMMGEQSSLRPKHATRYIYHEDSW